MERYNFKTVESKWQRFWDDNKSFKTSNDKTKKKFYCLEMFPYPSGKIVPELKKKILKTAAIYKKQNKDKNFKPYKGLDNKIK